jgi:hypothetical protein
MSLEIAWKPDRNFFILNLSFVSFIFFSDPKELKNYSKGLEIVWKQTETSLFCRPEIYLFFHDEKGLYFKFKNFKF